MIAEQLMHLAEAAVQRERRVFEVIGLDAQVRGDVVADHLQPTPLFLGEWLAAALLARQPGLEVGVDALGEGDEFVVLVDGKSD